jgi:hypothetical protein
MNEGPMIPIVLSSEIKSHALFHPEIKTRENGNLILLLLLAPTGKSSQ